MITSDKYPRTYHLPWSPGRCCDDKVLESAEHLLERPLVITEKLDGGNCCLTRGGVYARTHGSEANHPAFAPIKAIWASIRYDIPEGWSIFGEAIYAKHSIHYKSLPSHFLVFGVRMDLDKDWLSWDQVNEIAQLLNLHTVPELWHGEVESVRELKDIIKTLVARGSACGGTDIEGVVVRDAMHFFDFKSAVAKWVRAGHIQTDEHWMTQEIVPNLIRVA